MKPKKVTMDKEGIFTDCIRLVNDYTDVYDYQQDNFYGLYIAQREGEEVDLKDPAIKAEWESYFQQFIKKVFSSTYENLNSAFQLIPSSKRKIEFIEEVFDALTNLLDCTNEFEEADGFKRLIKNQMQSLHNSIHATYDNKLIILQLEARDPLDSAKLKLKLTRTEVTHLFVLLKDIDIIDQSLSDYGLALFISKNFLCVGKKESSLSKKKIEKYIGKIRSGEQFSDSSIRELKARITAGVIKLK